MFVVRINGEWLIASRWSDCGWRRALSDSCLFFVLEGGGGKCERDMAPRQNLARPHDVRYRAGQSELDEFHRGR